MALDLGKQVGPMPLGAWIAVVGTGLGIAVWSRRNGNAPAVTGDATTGGGLDTSGGGLTGEDGVGTGPGWVAVPPPTTSPVQPTPTTNDEWAGQAINALIALGYPPAAVQSAITHALQGTAMSVSEYALWTIALGRLGAPPYPIDVAPPVSVPGPTTPTTPPPPSKPAVSGRWYGPIPPGMNLVRIARVWYRNDARWIDIYNANRVGVRRPNGTVGFITPDYRDSGGYKVLATKWVGKHLWLPR